MSISRKWEQVQALIEAGIISASSVYKLLNLPEDGSHELDPMWLHAARSRVGQTWVVEQPFDIVVQANGDAIVIAPGMQSWGVPGRVYAADPGALLLVVKDTFLSAQVILSLDSGRTFTCNGWQAYCVLYDASEAAE